MSLLTRCPACTTLYKVVPDQLRISQGWVKCGQCGEIFDASQHLLEASTEPEELVVGPAVDPSSESADSPVADDLTPPASLDQGTESRQDTLAEPEPEPVVDLAGASGTGAQILAATAEPPASHDRADFSPPPWEPLNLNAAAPGDIGSESPAKLEQAPQPQPETTVDPERAPAIDPVQPNTLDTPATATESLSFMRDAASVSTKRRRSTQVMLGGLAVLLTAGMASQWVYQERDRLAAARPQWKPALERMCLVLRCAVAPLQQIESIAIDSAGFVNVGPDHYRLSFVLKNAAYLPLAVPSIELTLTDVQDGVVLRRVLSPQALAAASDQLAAHAEWPVSVHVRLNGELPASTVVGYRVLAFYP